VRVRTLTVGTGFTDRLGTIDRRYMYSVGTMNVCTMNDLMIRKFLLRTYELRKDYFRASYYSP